MRGNSRRPIHLRRAAPERAGWQSAVDPPATQPSRYRYWGFISYARSDERWAHSLHRQLEAYRIPRDVQHQIPVEIRSLRRLRPIFRDDDELAASGDLGGRLREALDRSGYLILVASPAAVASKWVNAEVQHFVDAERAEDILVLVVDGEPGGALEREALPAALRRLAEEPLWVDGRGNTRPSRKTFLRLVAGMLDVGFEDRKSVV